MFISEALAQSAAPAPGGADMLVQLAPFLFIFIILYFMIIRPQQKRARQHQDMIVNLRRGDTVVTSGGLIGKVAKVEDTEVTVELAEGMKVRVVRATIADVRVKGEPVKDA